MEREFEKNPAHLLGERGSFYLGTGDSRSRPFPSGCCGRCGYCAERAYSLCDGLFLRTLSRSFSIGDRIEVNGVRGDVIDQTLLTTTVLEIGPGTLSHQQTGRAITLPNKIFLECNVVNESYTDDFVLHTIVVSLYRLEDWKLAESLLLKIAGEETAGYMEDARKYFTMMGVKRGVELPSLEPRVILSFPDHKSVNLMLRACVPARAKGRVEQKMVRKFLDSFPIDRDALHD